MQLPSHSIMLTHKVCVKAWHACQGLCCDSLQKWHIRWRADWQASAPAPSNSCASYISKGNQICTPVLKSFMLSCLGGLQTPCSSGLRDASGIVCVAVVVAMLCACL